MDIALIAFTIIGGIVGIIQLIKWFKKSKKPKIDLDYRMKRTKRQTNRISARNINSTDPYFRGEETFRNYEIIITIELSAVNNSDDTAYYPKLYVPKAYPMLKFKKLSAIEPFRPHDPKTLIGEYKKVFDSLSQNRVETENQIESEFKDSVKIVIEYESANRNKCFTMFSFSDKSSTHLKKMPKGFIPAQVLQK